MFRNLSSLAAVVTLISVGVVANAQKPNVVIMMVDNLGWGELGAYGGGILRGAETPRLDTLAIWLAAFNISMGSVILVASASG